MATTTTTVGGGGEGEAWEEDEWELCNDDGFVYKRRKKRRRTEEAAAEEDESSTSAAAAAAAAAVDLEVEVRKRKKIQKKETLLKLKDRYQKELAQWDNLSNTLKEMEERTQHYQIQRRRQQEELTLCSSSGGEMAEKIKESVFRPLVDELLLQAEAQEAIIQDLSSLCDAAEVLCKAEEERKMQSLIDLPVWANNPGALLASLFDEDYCNDNDVNVQMT